MCQGTEKTCLGTQQYLQQPVEDISSGYPHLHRALKTPGPGKPHPPKKEPVSASADHKLPLNGTVWGPKGP